MIHQFSLWVHLSAAWSTEFNFAKFVICISFNRFSFMLVCLLNSELPVSITMYNILINNTTKALHTPALVVFCWICCSFKLHFIMTGPNSLITECSFHYRVELSWFDWIDLMWLNAVDCLIDSWLLDWVIVYWFRDWFLIAWSTAWFVGWLIVAIWMLQWMWLSQITPITP